MRVFLTGGTGLVGTRLVKELREGQHEVVLLTRRPDVAREKFGAALTVVAGDPTQAGEWAEAAGNADAVVNLAGENIFGRRWNDAFIQLIRDTRVRSTENVVQALGRNPRSASGAPKVLVNASAIGYYGPHGDEELTEDSPPGDDVMARVCVDWEAAAKKAEPLGVRVAILRIGIVLDKAGGALKQMLTPFKMYAGGPVGSGKQWMSWIHHEDLVGLILLALQDGMADGPINGTAPEPVPNREFAKALGRALRVPSFLPTPAFALRVMLGQAAQVVTTGQRVLPRRAERLGYAFKFPQIDEALRDALA
jgi:uncharacterized protein (TIGR01777 family)